MPSIGFFVNNLKRLHFFITENLVWHKVAGPNSPNDFLPHGVILLGRHEFEHAVERHVNVLTGFRGHKVHLVCSCDIGFIKNVITIFA